MHLFLAFLYSYIVSSGGGFSLRHTDIYIYIQVFGLPRLVISSLVLGVLG